MGRHEALGLAAVEALIGEHFKRERDRSFELYSLLTLSLWGDAVLSEQPANSQVLGLGAA